MNYDEMPAGSELDAGRKLPYHLTKKGMATRRSWYEKNKASHMERKRARRAEYAKRNPDRVRARLLLGQAVRFGYIPKPPKEVTRTWGNRWEFHHPDHSRPYYGCWLRSREHRLVDLGRSPCPPCTDHTEAVAKQVMDSWGLLTAEDRCALACILAKKEPK